MRSADEFFELVNTQGDIIGCARRGACHRNPLLMHRVVHVIVSNQHGAVYLQKRSMRKDIQPGKWDTSVGGHVQPGEESATAARRELYEELGLEPTTPLRHLYQYVWRSPVETEVVETFACCSTAEPRPNPDEIEQGRWWTWEQIDAAGALLTPNCREELRRYRAAWK